MQKGDIIKDQGRSISIVAISDTHGVIEYYEPILKMSGDIFIHGGDFTDYGIEDDFKRFFQFLDKLNFKHKIVISGNQDISLDNGNISPRQKNGYLHKYRCSMTREYIISELKKRCIYLEHEEVEVEGIKIFGSPYTPYYVGNAFQYDLRHEKLIWDAIPKNIDILLTHGPPYQICDKNLVGIHSGSKQLRDVSLKIGPKFHLFGHIHESGGVSKVINNTTFINLAMKMTQITFTK